MKILAIRITNLASLDGSMEIDFTQEPLCSAGIFAITGPTGAGKSTILDALCLALYAKTPRYLQAKEIGIEIQDVRGTTMSQGDVRGILRDGTSQGSAEVDFVGVDGLKYRANWNVRRARNRIDGGIQPETMSLHQLPSSIAFPGRKTEILKEIERLVGLNFEQFTRSVLLAQGDFTAFLKANKEEKASLLEKLTGTHIYSEISRLIFEKTKAAEQELRDLYLRKQGIELLTDEELIAINDREQLLDKELDVFSKEIALLTYEVQWHQQIAELILSESAARETFAQAIILNEEAKPAREKLRQIEDAGQTRKWAEKLLIIKLERNKKANLYGTASSALATLESENSDIQNLIVESDCAVAKSIREKETAAPLLAQAVKLDTLSKEKATQKDLAEKEFQEASNRHKGYLSELQAKLDEQAQNIKEISQLTQWKGHHENRKNIAEDYPILSLKITDLKKIVNSLEACTLQLQQNFQILKQSDESYNILISERELKHGHLQTLRKNWEAPFSKILLYPIEIKELQKRDAEEKLGEYASARTIWKDLYNASSEIELIQSKIVECEKELHEKSDEVNSVATSIPVLRANKETSEKSLHKARLQVAENVEQLRSELTAGDPCPVCGSTEHPFASHHPMVDQLLQALESDYRENEFLYEQAIKTESSIRERCINLTTSVAEIKLDYRSRVEKASDLNDLWINHSVYNELKLIPDPEKLSKIDTLMESVRKNQGELQKEIYDYYENRKVLDRQKSQIHALELEASQLSSSIKDLEREVKSHQESGDRLGKLSEEAEKELEDLQKFLSPYFKNDDWFINWKVNPEAFEEQIRTFSELWQSQVSKLEQVSKNSEILKATIKQLQLQSDSIQENAAKKEADLMHLIKELESITSQRKQLFNGENTDLVEASLNLAIEKYAEKQRVLNISLAENNQKIIYTKDQILQLKSEISQLDNDASANENLIKNWLTKYNSDHGLPLTEEAIFSLLNITSEEIEKERQHLRKIDDQLMTSEAELNVRSELLQKHVSNKKSERTSEELSILLLEKKAKLDESTSEINMLRFRKRQDSDNKSKSSQLLELISKQSEISENWSKLNELLGSADGKKFRQIAQEYTLDILLGYTNVHLEMLSKRYRIQRISNSLGLQVIDGDMGDEIRTVFSLSGGESFLVSLALALGLASLSSSRMKVESLFIDEGFGSLDPITLNIAMDALERLHNQGRKVGVISHVQEMTERIPVQIIVSKLSNGKSKVETSGSLS